MAEPRLDWTEYLDFPAEDIPELQKALNLLPAWRALRNIVGQRPEDFVIRASAMHAIQNTNQPSLERGDLDGALHYMTSARRENAIHALQEGDWLEHENGQWRITSTGVDLYNILLILFELGNHPYMAFSTLLFGVIKDLQGDPEMSLRGLVNQMRAMTDGIYGKIEMRSSIALQGEIGRARSAVKMARIAIDAAEDWRRDDGNPELFSEIHGAMAHLLRANEQLSEALAAVAAAHVALPDGYTPHEIIESLRRCHQDALTRVGQEAHLCSLPSRIDIDEETITNQAAKYIERDRFEPDLSIPEEQVPRPAEDMSPPSNRHMEAFAAAIEDYPEETVPLTAVLGSGEPHEVLHRFFALDFLGQADAGNPISELNAILERAEDEDSKDGVTIAPRLIIRKIQHA